MIKKIKLWLMRVVNVNSPTKMFMENKNMRNKIRMFILSKIFTPKQLCVMGSALYQAIEKYQDLYNNSRSYHYKNPRTLDCINEMQRVHDLCGGTVELIGVNVEEIK
jgi:hypothetical protein